MIINNYNKKGFLLPDSIDSMAAYHAKLFPDGRYMFRVHDCITGVRLHGELKTEQDFIDASEKLTELSTACAAFAVHINKLKKLNFENKENNLKNEYK